LAGISTLVPKHNDEPKVRSGQELEGKIMGRGWMDGESGTESETKYESR
jgi:hypothetical protein